MSWWYLLVDGRELKRDRDLDHSRSVGLLPGRAGNARAWAVFTQALAPLGPRALTDNGKVFTGRRPHPRSAVSPTSSNRAHTPLPGPLPDHPQDRTFTDLRPARHVRRFDSLAMPTGAGRLLRLQHPRPHQPRHAARQTFHRDRRVDSALRSIHTAAHLGPPGTRRGRHALSASYTCLIRRTWPAGRHRRCIHLLPVVFAAAHRTVPAPAPGGGPTPSPPTSQPKRPNNWDMSTIT